jgi:hypothetical protein
VLGVISDGWPQRQPCCSGRRRQRSWWMETRYEEEVAGHERPLYHTCELCFACFFSPPVSWASHRAKHILLSLAVAAAARRRASRGRRESRGGGRSAWTLDWAARRGPLGSGDRVRTSGSVPVVVLTNALRREATYFCISPLFK